MQVFSISEIVLRVSRRSFPLVRKRQKNTAGEVRDVVISYWLVISGAPSIIMVGKDTIRAGNLRHEFCTEHNITLKTVIHGRRQSLGV